MKKSMLVKLDECVHYRLVDEINRAGFKVDTVQREGLSGEPDNTIHEVCKKENLILITTDRGFGDINTYPPGTHPGVVVLKPGKLSWAAILKTWRNFLKTDEIRGCENDVTENVVIAEPNRVRVRRKN